MSQKELKPTNKKSKQPPFTHDIVTAKNKSGEVSVKINYKTKDGITRPISYFLSLNGKEIFKSADKQFYLGLWIPFIDMCFTNRKTQRVLIVGGGNQLLSNYLLSKYSVNITIIDKCAYLYLQDNIKHILKAKDFVNEEIKGETKKMFPVDDTLVGAYEDGILEDESFDLILVDNFVDSYRDKTGMYEPHIAELYHKLLKPKGCLIINHNFSIRQYNPKIRQTYDLLEQQNTKYDIKYYKDYLNHLNSLLVETDYIYQRDIKISLYSKVFVDTDFE